ncbi:MAG: hypothetical protein QOH31_776 [Verrucomicrobiota bacterium]|jgi:hypothetical protein
MRVVEGGRREGLLTMVGRRGFRPTEKWGGQKGSQSSTRTLIPALSKLKGLGEQLVQSLPRSERIVRRRND